MAMPLVGLAPEVSWERGRSGGQWHARTRCIEHTGRITAADQPFAVASGAAKSTSTPAVANHSDRGAGGG